VLWNVVATPEFSVTPLQWCFMVTGCVSYRGYFSEAAARKFAANLAAQGNDVYLAGVAAYSTLGWFADPLLDTILRRRPVATAGLIFHELAHQTLYIPDDTAFDEAFAVTVERAGVQRWLRHLGDTVTLHQVETAWAASDRRVALMQKARARLAEVYQAPLDEAQRRTCKAAVLDELRLALDETHSPVLNNAVLAAVGTYHDDLPAFQALLAQQGDDLCAFYQAARALGQLAAGERHARLTALAQHLSASDSSPVASPLTHNLADCGGLGP
jgi:predicted aminopeptidase